MKQRRLADPGLTAEGERFALSSAGAGQQAIDLGLLQLPAVEHLGRS